MQWTKMQWTKPEFSEITLGGELTAYVNTDEGLQPIDIWPTRPARPTNSDSDKL